MKNPSVSGGGGPAIRQEQRSIDLMLDLFCRDHYGGGRRDRLCGDCEQLGRYAHQRLDVCPFQDQSPPSAAAARPTAAAHCGASKYQR